MASFNLVQWNARGITNKIEDLLNSFDKNPDIIIVQETNLLKDIHFRIEGYETILRFGERKSRREGTGRGLIIALKREHNGWIVRKEENEHAQILTAEIYLNNKQKMFVTNIYRKTKKYTKEEGMNFWNMIKMEHTLDNHIIAGDFNAHHTLWGDSKCDPVGEVIAEGLLVEGYSLHNKNDITFRSMKEGNRDTAVDLTLSRKIICKNQSWKTLELHGSDHHPFTGGWFSMVTPWST